MLADESQQLPLVAMGHGLRHLCWYPEVNVDKPQLHCVLQCLPDVVDCRLDMLHCPTDQTQLATGDALCHKGMYSPVHHLWQSKRQLVNGTSNYANILFFFCNVPNAISMASSAIMPMG